MVAIEARAEADAILISVRDNGPGIAKKDHKKIFERFRQAGDTLIDKPQGTGLRIGDQRPHPRALRRHDLGRERARQRRYLFLPHPVSYRTGSVRPPKPKPKALEIDVTGDCAKVGCWRIPFLASRASSRLRGRRPADASFRVVTGARERSC